MNIITRSAAALAAGGLLAVGAAAAHADPPALISSASAACATAPDGRQSQVASLPAYTSAYPQTLNRITVNSSSGLNAWANWWISSVTAPGDVWWEVGGSARPGTLPDSAVVECSDGGAMNATFDKLAVPSTPTSFFGAMTPRPRSQQLTSTLAFNAPLAGTYRLSFDVTQGAISYKGSTISSHLDQDINTDAGEQRISVSTLDGPQARYTISVVALPVTVSNFAVQPNLAKQGAPLKIPYTLSGDATVTIRVLDAAGQPVRVLADQLAASRGDRSVRWDGIGLNGAPVPDGVYTIDLTVNDATGQPHGATAAVTLDRTAPAITMPSRVSRARAIVVPVADPTSGLRSAVLRVNGRAVARAVPAEGRIIYRPRGGFRRGARLRVTVTATDKANNTATVTRRYRAR